MSAQAKKNEMASKKNGKKIAIPINRDPSGGPIKLLVNDSADHMRLFAFSRFSLATIEGISDCAVLSRKTSARPKRNAVAINTRYKIQLVLKSVMEPKSFNEGRESLLNRTITPTNTVRTPRRKSMATINLRRSKRSALVLADTI